MNEQLDECLRAAQNLGGRESFYDGGASIELTYNPYDCYWVASASWSCGYTIRETASLPDTAAEKLLSALLLCR